MLPLTLPYKLAAIAATALIVALGAFWLDKSRQAVGRDKYKAEMVAETAKVLSDHAVKIKEAGEAHANNQRIINSLSGQLNRLHIKVPTLSCPDTTAESSDGAAGVLPGQIETAYREFESGLAEDAERADQLNIDAIKLNDSLP